MADWFRLCPRWRTLKRFKRSVYIAAALATIGTGASAKSIEGRATVIDGDTIEIHGTRIRLNGIDAPESSQLCWTRPGRNIAADK